MKDMNGSKLALFSSCLSCPSLLSNYYVFYCDSLLPFIPGRDKFSSRWPSLSGGAKEWPVAATRLHDSHRRGL